MYTEHCFEKLIVHRAMHRARLNCKSYNLNLLVILFPFFTQKIKLDYLTEILKVQL